LDYGVLPPIRHLLLNHNNKLILKESCWAISNITAGSKEQIQSVIDADLIPSVIQLVDTNDFEVKREAVWVLRNAIKGGTPKQFEYLINHGVVKALCNTLLVKDIETI
jgi:importin subunit alpha-1